ncbi:MAG TPA: diguanylate cyclase, partial [Thermoleophilaceae bacterium]|nr:diguanylate cyclase [Thermoleophilaceae bacterium]
MILRPVHLFCVAVAIAGAALLCVVLVLTPLHLDSFGDVKFFVLVPSVMLGELFPLELPRRSGDGEVTVSTMFSFALLLGLGLVPALAAQLAASVVQDRVARKPAWQVAFNIGQYTLSLAAASGVLRLVLGHAPFRSGSFMPLDLVAVVGAAAAFFVVNLVLVGRATTLYEGTPFVRAIRTDLAFGLSVGAVLLCLAPVVVTVLEVSPILYPLLLVPLLGIYAAGRQTVRVARAEHMATHDSLTELPNRRWFRETVDAALQDEEVHSGGLLLVDLNRFKEVNDTLGHHHGDLVLREIAARLSRAFREQDLVARLGGDEFAVFMPDARAGMVHEAVDRLQASLRTPVEMDGISIELGGSVGLAWYPEHGSDVDTLLQRADVAMYRAKAGQRALVTYRPEDDYHTPARLALVADLRRALAEERLVVHYQPQVDLSLGLPVAAEGLVRWEHPARGLLGPPDFIEVAEHTGLIKDLTQRVLDIGLADLRRWEDSGRRLSLSLNVSARSLLDRRFPHEVDALLSRHGVDGSALTLELTESS